MQQLSAALIRLVPVGAASCNLLYCRTQYCEITALLAAVALGVMCHL